MKVDRCVNGEEGEGDEQKQCIVRLERPEPATRLHLPERLESLNHRVSLARCHGEAPAAGKVFVLEQSHERRSPLQERHVAVGGALEHVPE